MTGVGQGAGQIRHAPRPYGALSSGRSWRRMATACSNSGIARSLALAPVGKPDAFEKLRAHLGLQVQIARDFRRAPIQAAPWRSASLPWAVERIGLREHVHQEGRHLLRTVALLRRRLARQLDPMVLPQRHAGDEPPDPGMPRRRAATASTAGAGIWRRCSASPRGAPAPAGQASGGSSRPRALRPKHSGDPAPCAWPSRRWRPDRRSAARAAAAARGRADRRCGCGRRRFSPPSLATTIWLGRSGIVHANRPLQLQLAVAQQPIGRAARQQAGTAAHRAHRCPWRS